MWLLFRQAQTYGHRPSDLVGNLTPWVAWMWDQAVLNAGTFIQNRLDERDDKGRVKWTFEQITEGRAAEAPKKQSAKSRWKAAFGRSMR